MSETTTKEQLAHAKSLAAILEWLNDNPEPELRGLVFMAVTPTGLVTFVASGEAGVVLDALTSGLIQAEAAAAAEESPNE